MKRLAVALAVTGLVSLAAARPAAAVCAEWGADWIGSCGSVGYAGCCDGPRVHWCDVTSGQLCEIDCYQNDDPSLMFCGWDAAGGIYNCGGVGPDPSCGAPHMCPGSAYAGACSGHQFPAQAGCGSIGYEGCCDPYGAVYWCACNHLYCIDCASVNPLCGWNPEGYYDCQTSGGADPSGFVPYLCGDVAPCTPSCLGKDCGDDGCGGSCGSCPAGTSCQIYRCQPTSSCTPSCAGRQCGDDGCGGSCGSCPVNYTCQNFVCQPASSCTPNCAGRQCGDNGCGGSCGTCTGGTTCEAGQCVVPCAPDCVGKVCGDDGCDGSCGECPETYLCIGGRCEPTSACIPDCGGRVCGSNGCGGMCGACGIGYHCDGATGQCQSGTCTPRCDGRLCGDDGCGGACGSCTPPLVCNAEGACTDPSVAPCVPDCGARVCGADGCGGSCGSCAPDAPCDDAGQCVPATPPVEGAADAAGPGGDAVGPTADAGKPLPDFSPGVPSCPAGYRYRYGQCVPVTGGLPETDGLPPGVPAAGVSGSTSGCSPVGGPSPSPALTLGLLGLLTLLRLPAGARRARRPATR